MKRVIYWSITILLFVFSAVMFIVNQQLRHRIETISDKDNWIEKSENVMLIVDTIYKERYVVAVDTITGEVKRLGIRRFCESEDYEE